MKRMLVHTKRYFIVVLIGVIFTANLITLPSAAILNEGRTSHILASGNLNSARLPLSRTERDYFIGKFSGNEMLSGTETHLIINRSIQSFPNLIHKINPFLLSLVSFGVFTYYFGNVNRKKRQHRSILSSFLGGHAPPGYRVIL